MARRQEFTKATKRDAFERAAGHCEVCGAGLPDRFWNKVMPEPNSGCWLWDGCTTVGYGRIYMDGKLALAHRVSYEAHKGPIPDGLQVDHLCRVKSCVNPDHLEAVTAKENMSRVPTSAATLKRDQTHCIHGHKYTQANTYRRPDGRRMCRECNRIRAYRYRP